MYLRSSNFMIVRNDRKIYSDQYIRINACFKLGKTISKVLSVDSDSRSGHPFDEDNIEHVRLAIEKSHVCLNAN